MRCITYAGETVITTDDVAEALVALTAAIASRNDAEAVSIPIVLEHSGEIGSAELVIGVGNDVLSVPTEWEREEPDFSAGAMELRAHESYPRSETAGTLGISAVGRDDEVDLDLGGVTHG